MFHVFLGHLTAAICEHFGIESTDDAIQHEATREWLELTANTIVSKIILPVESDDLIHALHRSLLHAIYLYTDLREAIRKPSGEAVEILANILYRKQQEKLCSGSCHHAQQYICQFSLAYIAYTVTHNRFVKVSQYLLIHNRFVNTSGKEGHT